MRLVDSIIKGANGGFILNGLRPPYGPYGCEPVVVQTFEEVVELLRKAALEHYSLSPGRAQPEPEEPG